MMEIKLCGICARINCTAANHEPMQAQRRQNMRACSDCEEYADVACMTITPAGNAVCPRCSKRRSKLAASRAQMSMFGQERMF